MKHRIHDLLFIHFYCLYDSPLFQLPPPDSHPDAELKEIKQRLLFFSSSQTKFPVRREMPKSQISNSSPKGIMWSAIPVALLCMLVIVGDGDGKTQGHFCLFIC